MTMTFDEFHNRLRILLNLDYSALVDAGVFAHVDDVDNEWAQFWGNPYLWFIRADDATAVKLWTLMQTRMRK